MNIAVWLSVARRPADEQQLGDSLMDWHISFTNLQFKDCLKAGLRNSVFRLASAMILGLDEVS